MDSSTLEDYLDEIGDFYFVKFFNIFQSYSNHHITKVECIDILTLDYKVDVSDAIQKCNVAKKIFDDKKEFEVLELILNRNSDHHIQNSIKDIYSNLYKKAV